MQNVTKRDDIRILKTMKSLWLIICFIFASLTFRLIILISIELARCHLPWSLLQEKGKKKSSFLENAKSLIHQWALSVLQDFSFFLLLSIWQPRETQNEAAYMAWLRKYFVMEEFEGFIGKIPEK